MGRYVVWFRSHKVNSAVENYMGSITHKLLYLLVLSTLTVPAAGTTIKTRYVIDDGQGFWSTESPRTGESAEGNPGTTLGEQRKYAHEFAVRLAERIVWIEDRYPMFQYTLVTEGLDATAVARATGGTPAQRQGDPRPFYYPNGVFCRDTAALCRGLERAGTGPWLCPGRQGA